MLAGIFSNVADSGLSFADRGFFRLAGSDDGVSVRFGEAGVVVVVFRVGCYMTAHCVAPQQSLMMATPDFVMDGLSGGASNVGLLGFGPSEGQERKRGR